MTSISRVMTMVAPILFCWMATLLPRAESHWWAIATQTLMLGTAPEQLCTGIEGLSRNQRALCQKYDSHMEFVRIGARDGINECKWQFRNDRWNCSTPDANNMFGKILRIDSKEVAFAYAVQAAGVVSNVARACREGSLKECGCSTAGRPQGLAPDWNWGGCGDNTVYAYGFAREFIDAKERDISPRKKKDRSRKVMNLHNNEVGRLVAVHSSRPKCNCHGVSGSCSVRTCWMQIPSFREIGNTLKQKYKRAVESRVTRRGKIIPRKQSEQAGASSLIFLESSPDYCLRNKKTGVSGTRGRLCNADSTGDDGCGLMCCGRGYKTKVKQVKRKCNCRFQWCCSVRCEMCEDTVKVHRCK